MHHFKRGQTLPIQFASVLAMLVGSFLIYNWSCVLRLQMQVQSDADAAAQLAVLPQVTQFNEIELSLYGANVEEYRLRTIMEALLLNVRDSAGCDYNNYPNPAQDNVLQVGQQYPQAYNCDLNYPSLRQAYIDSTNRYTQDVQLLESVADVTTTEQQSAAATIVTALQTGCVKSGDCNAKYFLNTYTARERALTLGIVESDAVAYAFEGYDHGFVGSPTPVLTPTTADVTVCENVKGMLPNIFGKTLGPVYMIARSAATPVATTQEWFEPGITTDPTTNAPYQQAEYWADVTTVDAQGWNYDLVNYSGNYATAKPTTQTYQTSISNQSGEFSAFAAWWNAAVVHPVKLNTGEQKALQANLQSAGCV